MSRFGGGGGAAKTATPHGRSWMANVSLDPRRRSGSKRGAPAGWRGSSSSAPGRRKRPTCGRPFGEGYDGDDGDDEGDEGDKGDKGG